MQKFLTKNFSPFSLTLFAQWHFVSVTNITKLRIMREQHYNIKLTGWNRPKTLAKIHRRRFFFSDIYILQDRPSVVVGWETKKTFLFCFIYKIISFLVLRTQESVYHEVGGKSCKHFGGKLEKVVSNRP